MEEKRLVDAVSVGREILPNLEEKGVTDAEQYITEMNDELSMMMSFTGFSNLKELDASALWIDGRKYQTCGL